MSEQGKIISMKLLIDKPNRKVLFAEAGKECVDFLFHLLSLPLGTVVRFLTKTAMIGSFGSLYGSLEDLPTDYIRDDVDKDCLLNINTSYQIPLLTVDNQASGYLAPKKFYTCITQRDYRSPITAIHKYVSDAAGVTCPYCKKRLDNELAYVGPHVGGYVKEVASYMIMDDLCVKPMFTVSTITLLTNKFNIRDMANLEEREVSLDASSAVALLKASLISKTVLTDVFLPKKPGFN